MVVKKYLDEYIVYHTLGNGKTSSVKLIEDNQGNVFAAKIVKQKNKMFQKYKEFISNESDILQSLDHSNIIKCYQLRYPAVYVKMFDSGLATQQEVAFLKLELCPNYDLHDYITIGQPFSEAIVRFYFNQILQAVKQMQEKGVCHRDLKPENILIDSNFHIKIADFGFAKQIGQKWNQTSQMDSTRGTLNFMAPEVYEKLTYNGYLADLFSLGAILFMLMTQYPPQQTPSRNDLYYRYFYETEMQDNFWDIWQKQMRKSNSNFSFSEAFKNLVNSLLAQDVKQRLLIPEILAHPWMQGPIAEQQEIRHAMQIKMKLIKNWKMHEKEKIKKQKLQASMKVKFQESQQKAANNIKEQQETMNQNLCNYPIQQNQQLQKLEAQVS